MIIVFCIIVVVAYFTSASYLRPMITLSEPDGIAVNRTIVIASDFSTCKKNKTTSVIAGTKIILKKDVMDIKKHFIMSRKEEKLRLC